MSLHAELLPSSDKNSRCLLIMLHGLGDSIEGYRWMPQALFRALERAFGWHLCLTAKPR